MKITTPKGYVLFWLTTLVFLGMVGFLGFRAVEHQVLVNHYQVEGQAKLQLSKVNQFVWHTLSQKATRLDAIANFLQLNDSAINEFVNKDTDVNQIFILDNKQLVYPHQGQTSTQTQQFITAITPIVEDPQLLYAHSVQDEQTKPVSGWYINYNHQVPLLIYWYQKDHYTVGFNVSYVNLLSNIISAANFEDANGTIKIFENNRLLYQSNSKSYGLLASQSLNYPLTNWKINYYGQPAGSLTIYLWGCIIILFVLACIGFIMFSLYREYTRASRQALQQVNFVSQVSHELKTPLTNITLYAELLREDLEDDKLEQQAYTDIIIQEGQRLSRLIQNILSFTKTSKIHIKEFNLSDALQELATTFKPSFASKGIDLISELPQDVFVQSDEDRVMQVICNFLSNAEKYAAQGKRIDLSLLVNATSIDIAVRDYGEGIAIKEQALIFKPFYRIKSMITEGVAGTGIGLTIAKQIATALGADIIVTATQPGVCFILRLKRDVKECL